MEVTTLGTPEEREVEQTKESASIIASAIERLKSASRGNNSLLPDGQTTV